MTLNKSDLVQGVIEKVHLKKKKKERQQYLFPELNCTFLSRKKAGDLVNSLLAIIAGSLERGERVAIQGFGRFQVKFKWAGKGRNPRTGEMIFLKSRRVIQFKVAPGLKEKLNK
jgi:DNA-binding protein HU-beta